MRIFFSLCLALGSLCAHELTYISNDASHDSLIALEQTYKQSLLVNDKKVYLIPIDCRLERYFGGASQIPVKQSAMPYQTQKIIMTQAVFEAKDEGTIKENLEVEKAVALVEGKRPKAFLDDKEGRGYGGASQIPLDFTFQKIAAKQVHMKPETKETPALTPTTFNQPPSCQLLDDGTGYQLQYIKDASLFTGHVLHALSSTIILFD